MNWIYLVLIICSLAGLFAVVKEYARSDKRRLVLRITATLLGVAALACIAVPISYRGSIRYSGNEAVLLTAGFSTDSLNKFKNDSLYTTDPLISLHFNKAKLVIPYRLKKNGRPLTNLHLLGYGLTESELTRLDSIPVVFHPSPYPAGIVSASWTEKLKQGQPFVIQGKFNHTMHAPVRLILKELNTSIDSTVIEQQGLVNFELKGLPKSTGRIVDQLLVLNGKDTIVNEPVPFEVSKVEPLKFLMISSSLDFENKFLKNWLTQQGFAVAIRSAISKNKVTSAFINIQQMPLNHLSASVLDKFDLLLADLSSLKALSSTENSLLNREVSQNGLGVIVRADTIIKTALFFQNQFSIYQPVSKEQKVITLHIQGSKSSSKIFNGGQLFISDKDGQQALVSDAQNRLLAAVNLYAQGKVVCTTLTNTYRLDAGRKYQ